MDYKDLQWKPLMDKAFENLLVDRTGQSFNYHPILVLEMDDDLIFLKAQTAHLKMDSNGKIDFIGYQKERIQQQKMVLIKPKLDQYISNHEIKPLFRNQSVVDTSQIFIISKQDFENVYKYQENKEILFNTRKLTFLEQEEIINQVKNNIEKQEVSLTRITKTDLALETRLLVGVKKDIEHDYDTNIKKASNELKEYTKKQMDVYLDKYENQTKKQVLEKEQYLKQIKQVFDLATKEIDEDYEYLDKNYDPYCFDGIALKYDLTLDNGADLKWYEKAKNEFAEVWSLSNVEKEYYQNNVKEYEKKYPDLEQQFHNYCKETKYTKMQNILVSNEQEAKKLNAKEIQKQCTDLRYGVTLANYKALDEQQRNNYHQKVNNTTQLLDTMKKEKDKNLEMEN